MIIRNANKLERLSATLLPVARIDSQTLKLEKTIFDINEKIITLIADTHASLAKKVTVTITVEVVIFLFLRI